MTKRVFLVWLIFLAGCTSQTREPIAAVSVLTQHNDNMRTGASLQETVLNVSNVSAGKFGKLFERSVDGDIYGQPLYVPNVDVPGKGRRNLVYVATMHNTVYAFDADRKDESNPVWMRQLGPSVPTSLFCEGAQRNIRKEIGIVSTPVISLSRQALYTVTFTIENGERRHYLHALDLTTGNEKFNGPKGITADGFAGRIQNQRPALLLANDTIYVAFGGYGDCGPFHGWVFGFNADTLDSLPRSFNTNSITPAGNGIWQAGQGPAADADGNVYLMVGNGTFRDILPPLQSPADKITFNEQAVGQPAAIDIGSRIMIAWSARDTRHLKIATWRNGTNFSDTQMLDDAAVDGPALAAGYGRLFLGWTENDSQHANPIYLRSTTDLKHWTGEKVAIPGASSIFGPSLAYGAGRLFAAWTDKDKNIVIRSSVDGTRWQESDKAILPAASSSSPHLAFIDDQLFLSWTDGSQVNLARSEDGRTFFPVAKKWSGTTHASLVKEGPFWLAWTRRDGSIGLAAGRTPADLVEQVSYRNDRSESPPALVAFNGPLFVLWTGSVNGSLNIARVTEIPALANGFVKLRPDLSIADWFTVWNTDILSRSDVDVGSSGPLLLPGTDLITGGGKEGKMYVLRRNDLGGFCPPSKCGDPGGDTQIAQWFQAAPKPCEISPNDCGTLKPAATFYHIHGAPAYWDGPGGPFIYVWSEAGTLRRFKFENGKFITTPVTSEVTTPEKSMPGAMLSLSANGGERKTGIVWASHPVAGDASEGVVPGILRAIDATTLKELWNTDMDKADTLGFISKFAPVTIANGKVYAATLSGKLVVFGLK